MLKAAIRPILLLLSLHHLLVFTVPYASAFYHELMTVSPSMENQLGSDENNASFIVELKELELEENDVDFSRMRTITLVKFSLLFFSVFSLGDRATFIRGNSKSCCISAPLHVRLRSLLI